ncbi:MAG: phenylacetate-CoA oxygenase subunit PaaC [Rhizobiaceae bacterium]|nr:phenylacetate-CoA oxygenase subunit PaaC [Hyphomicrobiales bacterium]NRB31097.1 phenylacetate-CoA oxygenase subunit PaaC [Rhizobiaceae bacterium]
MSKSLANALIALGDDHLILGHRLSEWCGHAPMLEEDLSMPNMALDLLGQARNLYTYAGELEGEGRTEDDLAYLRKDREYKNLLLVERPNGDFAHTMLRQLYFAAFMQPYWQAAMQSKDATIAGFAAKAVKEIAYHIRHAGEWVVRLGDGTEESARRMKHAVDALHIYTDELFTVTDDMAICIERGLLPDPQAMRAEWQNTIAQIFDEALLTVPEVAFPQEGGRDGRHTEDFGHLLSELQYMQRAYPDMAW